MSILENINLKMSVDTKQVNKQFKDATNTVVSGLDAMTLGAEEFEAKWADITDNIRSVKRVASGIAISAAIYGVASALTSASAAVLTFSNNLDEARISMEYFARDSKQAQQYIRELENFAAYTPFSTESAISMAKYLQAMSVPMESSKAVLTVISDTAAATGASEENMQRIVTAMGQVLTKGKLAAEEVRQLANANIPIYDILKEELNLTGQQIKNLGNLNIEGSKAVVAILDGLQKRYEGASAKIAETMGGMVETIKDDALIISSSFFTGAIDGIEEKLRGVRDTLDEWRDIAMHQGTGGMIEYILGDLDPSGELEQLVIDAIAGIKNLSATIRSFAIEDGTLLKTFGATAYASIMSVVVAADYLLRGINTLKSGADKILSVVNELTGSSLTLTDVAAGLLIFKTVGNTMMFASNTAMWLGKQVITLGTSVASIIPGIAGANALVKGLTASMISMGAAAAVAYGGIKLMNAITGVSDSSTLVTDEYKEAFKQYDDALNAYSDNLNASYEALSDGAFEAFADIEEQSKKSAKKVQKTWLMSFDEVFQIREDPDAEDSELEDFAAVDWGKYFSLPLFRFPERVAEGVEEAIWKADEAIDAARDSLDGIAGLLPLVIGGLTMLGTSLKNRSAKIAQLQSEGKLRDEDYTYKEQLAKFKDVYKKFAKNDDALLKLTETYKALDNLDEIRRGLDDAKLAIVGQIDDARAADNATPTANNKAVIEALEAQQDRIDKLSDFIERQASKRNILAENIEIKQKQTIEELRKLKEQRAKVGSNVEIPTKGIDTAASIVSARKINGQLEDLNKFTAEILTINAAINNKTKEISNAYQDVELRSIAEQIAETKKALKKATPGNETSLLNSKVEALIKEANIVIERRTGGLATEISYLQKELSDKLTAMDRSIKTAGTDISKHLQSFSDTKGIDLSVYDNIVASRLNVVADEQARLVNAITRAPDKMSTESLDTLTREIKLANTAVDKLVDSGAVGMEDTLHEVTSTNKAINDWLSSQTKYNNLQQEIDLLSSAPNAAALETDINRLVARRFDARKRLDVSKDNIQRYDKISNDLKDIKAELADATAYAKNAVNTFRDTHTTINKLASAATEVISLVNDGTVPVGTRLYTEISKAVGTLENTINGLSLTNPYRGSLQKLRREIQLALNGETSSAELATALENFNSSIKNTIRKTTTNIQDDVLWRVAEFASKTPVEAAISLSDLTAVLDDEVDKLMKVNIFTDSFSSLVEQSKMLDKVAGYLMSQSEAYSGVTKRLLVDLSTDIRESVGTNLAEQLDNTIKTAVKHANYNNETLNAQALTHIQDALGNVSRFNVDAINTTINDVLNAQDAKKLSDAQLKEGNKLYVAARDKIVDIAQTAEQQIMERAAQYAPDLSKRGFFNANQVNALVNMQDEITKWVKAGKDAYEAAWAVSDEITAETANKLNLAVTGALDDAINITPPIFEGLQSAYAQIDEAISLNTSLVQEINEIQRKAVEDIKNTARIYGEWRKAQNNNNLKILQNVDASISNIQSKVDVVNKSLATTLPNTQYPTLKEKIPIWTQYKEKYPVAGIPGGFYNATGLTGAASFNTGTAKYAYADIADVIKGSEDAKFILGKAAVRQGFNEYGITRQGNNFYDALKSIVLGGADEVALTTNTAISKGYAAAFNIRTKPIIEKIFGNVYRGGSGGDAEGRIVATLDGLLKVSEDTYGLVSRTLVNKQETLINKIISVIDAAKQSIITDTGKAIPAITFKEFMSEFGLMAEDIVSKVGASLAIPNTAGTYLSFTDAAKILETNDTLKLQYISPDKYKDVVALEKYVREAAATNIMRSAGSSVTDNLFSSNMYGLMILPDDAVEEFSTTLYENAKALEAATYLYKYSATTLDGGAEKLISMTNGLNKSVGLASMRFDDLQVLANKISAVPEAYNPGDFNKYVKRLVATSTTAQSQKQTQAVLKELLSALEKSSSEGLPFTDRNIATVDTRQYKYTLDGDLALLSAKNELEEALSLLESRAANVTITFNDVLRALELDLVPAKNIAEKFTLLEKEAAYLEESFGLLSKSVSDEIRAVIRQHTFKDFALSNNPFRILRNQEAVGKLVTDIMEDSGKLLTEIISEYPKEVQEYIKTAEKLFREDTLEKAALFPLSNVAENNANVPKIATATVEQIEANEVAAGKFTAEKIKDNALLGKIQEEYIRPTVKVRDQLPYTADIRTGISSVTEAIYDEGIREEVINRSKKVGDTVEKAVNEVEKEVSAVSKIAEDVSKRVENISKATTAATEDVAEAVSYITDIDVPLDAVESLSQFVEKASNENITFTDVDAIEDAIKKQAEKIWGSADYTEMAEKAGLIEKTSAGQRIGSIAEAVSNNKFINAALSDFTIKGVSAGFSIFDVVDSIRQFFDTRSEGIDEFERAYAEMTRQTGFELELPTKEKGTLVSAGEAFGASMQNFIIEGVITGLAINAAGTAATTALGITGAAATAVSLPISAAIALAASAAMSLTGGYKTENVAAGSISKMLEDHNWAYDQVYVQTGDEKKAKEAQLKAQRMLYTEYYDKMNGWSVLYDSPLSPYAGKNKIANLNTNEYVQTSNLVEGTDAEALEYAIAKLTNSTDTLSKYYVDNKGALINKDTNEEVAKSTLDTKKLEEFLYAAITTGAPQRVEEYDNAGFFGKLKFGKLSNIEEQYRNLMKNVDSLTEARIRDMYKLEFEAGEFIAAHNESEIKALLETYGLAFGDMATNIEGIIQLYNGTIEYTNSILTAKAAAINSGTFEQVTPDLLLSNVSGTVNRLLDFDISSVDQGYLDALSDATGIYLQSMSDTMTALTLDIDKVRENITGFTLTMPDEIMVGTEKLSIKALGADASAVDILAGMGVQINSDGTITIDNVAQNVNKSGYTRELAMSGSSISGYEQSMLENIGVTLHDVSINEDDKTTMRLSEEKMLHAIEGLTFTLNGVDATSIPLAVVEQLKTAGINITQNESTGAMSATISDKGFITGGATVSDILGGVDTSRISADLRDALESIDALVKYYNGKGESAVSAANGVVLNTGFKSGEYSKALESNLTEAGGTLQEALNANGEEVIYLALNKVSEDWSEAVTAWATSDITPDLKAFLQEIGAEVTTAGEYTIVDTSKVMETLATDNSKYLTELLFDNAELWDSFPEELQNTFIEAGLATQDGFITLSGEVINGWYSINDMLAKSWQALDTDTVEAFLRLQGTTLKSWDELTEEQKVKLANIGIATEQQYMENSNNLLAQHGESWGLLREDVILGWDELSQTSKDKLAAMGITNQMQYEQYLANMDVATGQGLSTVDATTAAALLAIDATTASGWAGIKKVTNDELSETQAAALGYMKFEDLPETIQTALAQGKEGSAYEQLYDGWYSLTTCTETQLGNLNTVASGQLDNMLDTTKTKVAQLRELLSSPEMMAETYMANLSSLASENLKAAKSRSNKYANGGNSFTYDGSWGGYNYDSDDWQNWSNKITIGKQFVAFDKEGGAYYFYDMYLDGDYYGQIAQSAQTGVRKKWLREGGVPEYNEDSEIPAFKLGGLITGDGLFRAGEFGMNEAVLPLEQPAAMARVGQALAASIPAYELVAPLAGALGMRDGGVAQFSRYQKQEPVTQPIEEIINSVLSAQAHRAPQPTSSESNMRPLYVGTLIADKSSLRELNRKMKIVERQDGGR